jgi:hypothetical protein
MSALNEPLTVVRIRQPLCSRTFGVAPCNATGARCFNTDETCRFRSALDLTSEVVLDFVSQDEAHPWNDAPGAYQPALATPALIGAPQIAPTELNVADGDQDKASIGLRAVVTIPMADFASNDVGLDPYVSTRSYDPLTQGTFWSKWLKRNPFHEGYALEIYEGQRGDALAAMIKRSYRITKIDRTADQVQVTAKDILSKITDTGILWPPLSPGQLLNDISATASSITVINASSSDYPASGFIRIGDEIIEYTSRTGAGSVTFTGCTRGVLDTTASTQKRDARAQRVVPYIGQRCDVVMNDILVNGGGIPASFIDTVAWAAEVTEWRPEFLFTTYLTEPTPVDVLAGEVCASSLMHLWWDERTQKIQFEAQKPEPAPVRLTWENDILRGSYREMAHPEQRASQFIVYYRPRSWIKDLNDPTNYQSAKQYIDAQREVQYGGQPVVRQMFSRWIQGDALAITLAGVYVGRFRDVRRKISFQLAEPVVWTGDQVEIVHYADVDIFGAPVTGLWLITKAEPVIPGARYAYEAEDNNMVGQLWEWVSDAVPEWASASPTEKATIGYWLTDDDLDLDGNPQPWRWL